MTRLTYALAPICLALAFRMLWQGSTNYATSFALLAFFCVGLIVTRSDV